jgi:2-polyprenyl-3-methyl-5-hydroxy-6-metoxy-1,4-benzoquinol methylase
MPTRADLHQIADLCPKRWVKHYTRSKLSSDPVYGAVAKEVIGTHQPILDIGCGIGLLAHYLHACGHSLPITGFDYDPRKIDSAVAMATAAGHRHLSFTTGDARTGLPQFSGQVVILDILQFFTESEQDALLTAAASRVAPGAKLIVRSGLRDNSSRFRITVLVDYLAKACFWMKAAPTRYPDAAQFQRVLVAAGLKVSIQSMWGVTPFNNFLIVGERHYNETQS